MVCMTLLLYVYDTVAVTDFDENKPPKHAMWLRAAGMYSCLAARKPLLARSEKADVGYSVTRWIRGEGVDFDRII